MDSQEYLQDGFEMVEGDLEELRLASYQDDIRREKMKNVIRFSSGPRRSVMASLHGNKTDTNWFFLPNSDYDNAIKNFGVAFADIEDKTFIFDDEVNVTDDVIVSFLEDVGVLNKKEVRDEK